MIARRFTLPLTLLAVVAVAAGCGGGHAHDATHPTPNPVGPPAPAPGHPCSPSDYYMQCGRLSRPAFVPRPAARSVVAYGIDFGWSCPNARALGAAFGASYLSTDASKNWTAGCVGSYHAQRLATVAVWETAATRAAEGYTAGRQDALRARAQAQALGEPANRPIYFAVDFDTSGNPGVVVSYFRGVDAVLGAARSGAYGGFATMQVLFGYRLVAYGWQTAAWSYGAWDGRAQIEQYSFGASLDWDRAVSRDYGQWPYTPPKPPPPPIAYTYWQACSALDAIHWWKAHGGRGRVSAAQHRHAVAIRKRLRRDNVGCARPGWQLQPPRRDASYPFRLPPPRRGALAN